MQSSHGRVGPNGAVDYSHGWSAVEPVGPIVICRRCPGGAEETSAVFRSIEHVPLVELNVVGVQYAHVVQELRIRSWHRHSFAPSGRDEK